MKFPFQVIRKTLLPAKDALLLLVSFFCSQGRTFSRLAVTGTVPPLRHGTQQLNLLAITYDSKLCSLKSLHNYGLFLTFFYLDKLHIHLWDGH